jgi:hypothetical protein
MSKILDEIESYVKEEIKRMSPSQVQTLKALLFSGYKGEREIVLRELLKTMGEKSIQASPLTESFVSIFEGSQAIYWRITPEFYRTVRKEIFKDH